MPYTVGQLSALVSTLPADPPARREETPNRVIGATRILHCTTLASATPYPLSGASEEYPTLSVVSDGVECEQPALEGKCLFFKGIDGHPWWSHWRLTSAHVTKSALKQQLLSTEQTITLYSSNIYTPGVE